MTQRPPLPSAEQLFEQLGDAVYLIDPDTSNIVWCNRKAWESLGLTAEDVLNHSVLSLQKDVVGMPQWSEIAAVIRQSQSYLFVGRHRHQAGHEVAVEVLTTAFELDGQPYFLSVARDITSRVATEGSDQIREKQLWFALNEASDGLWDWNVTDSSLYFSPQLKRMLGYGPEEMAPVLDTWAQAVHPDDVPNVMAVLNEHLQGKRTRYEAEYRLRNRNGHYIWVSDRGRVCERDDQGQPLRVVGMVHDISEHKQLQSRLQTQASLDALSGLPNRRQGERFLKAQLDFCRRLGLPLGVCFLDIDHFKHVNDALGHAGGDRLIQSVAQAVQGTLRASDMVCRWGGDEFVIVAPSTNRTDMALIAQKARDAVYQALQGQDHATGISLGVAAFPQDAHDMGGLLAQADAALYKAKARGRNRVALAGD